MINETFVFNVTSLFIFGVVFFKMVRFANGTIDEVENLIDN